MIVVRICRGDLDDVEREFIALVVLEAPHDCANCRETIGTGQRAFFSDRRGFAHPTRDCPLRGARRSV